MDSQTYVAAIREITGQDDMPQHVGSHVEIQYNPKHPARHYFAPERKLAGRLVIFLSLIAAGIAIAFAIKGAS